jgi:gliding motility-associated-like protein
VEHNDKIKDLFSEKLGNFESSVRPELWSNIASQIGATTTVATVSTGVSLFTKTIIGLSVAAAIGGFGYFAWNNDDQQADKNDVQVTADKKVTQENATSQSSTDAQNTVQRNGRNENAIDTYSTNEMIGEFNMPTSEDFLDVLLENKELPISYVQIADTKPSEIIEEKQSEDQIEPEIVSNVSEDHSTNTNSSPERVKEELELPNYFSPNNDGANDYFEIKSEGLTDFSLVVLDMNGKPVFQTTDTHFKWDGTNFSNEKVIDGNYLYYITAKDSNAKQLSKSQSLRINSQR